MSEILDKAQGYNKEYYDKNKEWIRKYQNERVLCNICNKFVARANLNRHSKCSKHEKCKNQSIANILNNKLLNNTLSKDMNVQDIINILQE